MAMMLLHLAVFLFGVGAFVNGQITDFSPIDTKNYPSVIFYSKGNGSFILAAGLNGDITIETSPNDTVFYKNVDLLHIIQLVNATPPVWDDYGTYGYLGVFRGLKRVSVFVHASDPSGLELNYTVVAGDLPVGVSLHTDSGELRGVAPDIDTTYVFTVRATNKYGKFADAIFKMVIKDSHVCKESPCKNEGTCTEAYGDFTCNCLNPFGGTRCELKCSENPLGVSETKKSVHNAQMSAFNTNGQYYAYNGRVGNKQGWMGINKTSWLQVDLEVPTLVYGAQMAGQDANYNTKTYLLQYSLNGQDFESYVSQMTGTVQEMTGSATTSAVTTMLDSPVMARFIRFLPITYGSKAPLMKVELIGCHQY